MFLGFIFLKNVNVCQITFIGWKSTLEGGGGGNSRPPDVNKNSIKGAINALIGPGTKCNEVINKQFGTSAGHGSIGDMLAHVDQVAIWDLANNPSLRTTIISTVIPDVTNQTQSFREAYEGHVIAAVIPIVVGNSSRASTNIVLTSSFYQLSAIDQQATLIHEMLHVYTNLDDAALSAALGLTNTHGAGLDAVTASAQAINEFITSNCTKKQFDNDKV